MKTGDVVGGKYRIIRVLGEGAMGSVWEALNERTSRRVALKLILKPSEDLRRRLLREAHACGGLSHRNIVELYDVGETDTHDPFLVMQLLQGETLAACLEHHRRLASQTAAHIARDIALALAAAHEARVIHRDLKPANVFMHRVVGNEGGFIVKVVDFGVSRLLDASDTMKTRPGTIVGSPAYMSPEQFMMAEDLDHRTDIWSLGICLFEMLAGARPFLGKTYQDIFEQVTITNAPRVTSRVRFVDDGLATIVARCLERDRFKRIGSATELASMLDRYANARPDAPIVVASPTKEITDNGTVIITPEVLPVRASGPDSRAPLVDGASRQAPWRENPLDDILTATAAALSSAVASTEAGVTTSVGGPIVPSSNTPEPGAAAIEPRKSLPENGRPKRRLVMVAAVLVIGIVCVTSVVVANRVSPSGEPAAQQPPLTNVIASMTTAPIALPVTTPDAPLTTTPKNEPTPIVAVQPALPDPPEKIGVINPPPPPPTVKPGIVQGIKPTPFRTGTKPGNRKPIIPF